MKYIINATKYINALILMCFSINSSAGGQVYASSGVHNYLMDMSGGLMSNTVGASFSESFSSASVTDYYYDCVEKDSAKTTLYYTTKYLVDMTPLSDNWYSFDDYFDIKTAIYLDGYLGEVAVPIYHTPGQPGQKTACVGTGKIKGSGSITIGNKGSLSLRLKKKIINGYSFPYTKLVAVAAAKSVSGELIADISNPFATITIDAFAIELPEKCEINGGQTIDIDFGDVSTTKLDGEHYPKVSVLNVSCSSGDFDSGLSSVGAEFIGASTSFSGDYFSTNHNGIGIKVRANGSELIKPNDKKMLSLTDGKTTLPLTFNPVSQSKNIDAGEFNSNIVVRLFLE